LGTEWTQAVFEGTGVAIAASDHFLKLQLPSPEFLKYVFSLAFSDFEDCDRD
jgi:hypothetical protein